jgi:hypothetical protein
MLLHLVWHMSCLYHTSFPAALCLPAGGHAIGGRTNDLFLLDLSVWQWSQPPFAGTSPSPRQAAAVAIGRGNLLVVHGGRNNFVLEDLYILDFVVSSPVWLTPSLFSDSLID